MRWLDAGKDDVSDWPDLRKQYQSHASGVAVNLDQPESEWRRRACKRAHINSLTKMQPRYMMFDDARRIGNLGPNPSDGRPRTPDPTDRRSKRCWEKSMSVWREQLRFRHKKL